MIIKDIEQGSDEWFEFRKKKISGTRLSEIYSKTKVRKIGFYKIIAEFLGLDPDDEIPSERGLRLEQEAIDNFEDVMGLKVARVGVCISDDNPAIINSPDGLIKVGKKYKAAVEVKCLSSARHLQMVIENEIPKEFESQVMQYFIVNPDLETLYFVSYDPRVISIPMHIIEVSRKDLGDKPKQFFDFQVEQLNEINEIVERLSF